MPSFPSSSSWPQGFWCGCRRYDLRGNRAGDRGSADPVRPDHHGPVPGSGLRWLCDGSLCVQRTETQQLSAMGVAATATVRRVPAPPTIALRPMEPPRAVGAPLRTGVLLLPPCACTSLVSPAVLSRNRCRRGPLRCRVRTSRGLGLCRSRDHCDRSGGAAPMTGFLVPAISPIGRTR